MSVFEEVKSVYQKLGVDVDKAIKTVLDTPFSIHCWQGDDVLGFEGNTSLTGGIQATGNYPGRATNVYELMSDIEKAMSLIPGTHKVNLHANYVSDGPAPDRDQITPQLYKSWADWAVDKNIGLDFNTTFFSHEKSDNGTLTAQDNNIREFWIEHAKNARKVSEYFASRTGKTSVINHWIPDGSKEVPIDTLGPRVRLKESLDEIFKEGELNNVKDSVESKLFGIGAESYTPGSNEFYLAYAMTNPSLLLTLDTGHFHPTETVSQKISAIAPFKNELLLHLSRPVRWDSDHVVLYDDETKAVMNEIIRNGLLNKTYIAMDFFDASINRVAAWVIGIRNAKKALLNALLEPIELLKKYELEGDNTSRLALWQAESTMPFGAVWNRLLELSDMPCDMCFMKEIKKYEAEVLSKR